MSAIDRLISQVDQLIDEAGTTPAGLCCLTLPLSGELAGLPLHSLPEMAAERYLWARPAQAEYWLGIGSSWAVEVSGEGHLERLARLATGLQDNLHPLQPAEGHPSPRLSIASERNQGRLNLPQIQILQLQGASHLILILDNRQTTPWKAPLVHILRALTTPVEPSAGSARLYPMQQTPAAAEWLDLAGRALSALHTGQLEKLVLSRRVVLGSAQPLSPAHLLQTLLYKQSGCTLFSLDRHDGCWVGASPERLLDQTGRQIATEAVAGTIRRDPSADLDRRLGAWLLQDGKNRHEHRLVVQALREALAPLCAKLNIAEEPQLLKLRGLQHLQTPIHGQLDKPLHALTIAHLLHPSPAIGGYPRAEAEQWLAQHEPIDRRLFTGLVGWLDTAGNAAINVALRCACLQGDRVELFAGAGLVGDSDALAEWEETELKLENMRQALGEA